MCQKQYSTNKRNFKQLTYKERIKTETLHKSFIVKTDDNKVGIITYAATPIIPPEYDNIEQINNQLYLVAINKKFGIINKEGKTMHDRPEEIEARKEIGHWEMDLV